MSFLSWLLGSPAPPREDVAVTARLPGPGEFAVEVVGESHYQRNLERICGQRSEDGEDRIVQAVLVLEDANPHDASAVRVDVDGVTVGYLRRDVAREFRQRLSEAGHPRITAMCDARIRGGWERPDGDRGYYGVWLDLPTADE